MDTRKQNLKTNLADVPATVNHRGILTREIINVEGVKVLNLLLQDEDEISPHATPTDIVFYVIRGKGYIEIGGEGFKVQAGDVLYSPKFVSRGVRALAEGLELLVLKTPNPTP